MKAMNKQHSKVVSVPYYESGSHTCGITVHFLPCDDIQVTTTCYTFDNPKYPIKLPLEMKEPKVCPKQ
ncbi:MAG: DUF3304 domain-containing protein [Vibrio sp.]